MQNASASQPERQVTTPPAGGSRASGGEGAWDITSVLFAAYLLVFVLELQKFESNVLMPNIVRSQTKVSPLLALLALFIGASLGGLLGVLVAIPLAAGARVFVVQVVAPGIRRWTGAEPVEAE